MSVEPFPFLAPKSIEKRMLHFDENVYDTSQSSYLFRLIDALCGDAGASDLKKELLIDRLSKQIETMYFQDLDHLFENALGLARLDTESYIWDPIRDMLTSEQWNEIKIKDAWYRARARDYIIAMTQGGTPQGYRSAVRSVLGVGCELFETWKFRDDYGYSGYSTAPNLLPRGSFDAKNMLNDPGKTDSTKWRRMQGYSWIIYPWNWHTGKGYVFVKAHAADTYPLGPVEVWSPIVRYVSGGMNYTISHGLRGFWAFTVPSVPADQRQATVHVRIRQLNDSGNLIETTDVWSGTVRDNVWRQDATTFTTHIDCRSFQVVIYAANVPLLDIDSVSVAQGNKAFDYLADDNARMGRIGTALRNEVTVKPHVGSITPKQKLQLIRTIEKIKPVDSVLTVDLDGLINARQIEIGSAASDSIYFEVSKRVTGSSVFKKIPQSELYDVTIPSESWIEPGVTKEAPHAAFNSTQEYSHYYTFNSGAGTSMIDSVDYEIESPNGKKRGETTFQIWKEAPRGWGEWELWELADSPDNFPGGKFGQTPTQEPALLADGEPYSFPWASQEAYVASRTAEIVAQGGEVSADGYRLPLSNVRVSVRQYDPQEAIPDATPVRDSSVTTNWIRQVDSVFVPKLAGKGV